MGWAYIHPDSCRKSYLKKKKENINMENWALTKEHTNEI